MSTPTQRDLPRLRDRVAVKDRHGVFIVVAINNARRQVDLAAVSHVAYMFDVPFTSLVPARPLTIAA
jgi:hypothetical protein